MTALNVYSKTMKFMWLKLLLGIATVVISAIMFGVLVGIGSLFGDGGRGITILIWLSATGVVRFVLMHYFGYMVKAGHIAIIATAVITGKVPDNQVEVAKKMVTERFATSNIYFAVDSLISGAVKQIQGMLDNAGNLLGGLPGIDWVMKIGKLFISISLGYIDECCLGYTFYKKDQNAFKSAADGVVIYAQNWKKLLKDAAVTTVVVISSMIGITLAIFLVFGFLFNMLHWSTLVAFILASFVALAVKFAFIDSWVLVKMMVSYMEVVPSTVITFDLYGKLCDISAKFKELFNKGQNGQPQPTYAGVGVTAPGAATTSTIPVGQTAPTDGEKMVFCGQCGEKSRAETKFCGGCGAGIGGV